MKTKEKLELSWKYLSTFLLFILGVMFIRSNNEGTMKAFPLNGEEGAIFLMDKQIDSGLEELDVQVTKEVVDGDSVISVKVNGEKINSDSFKEDDSTISWTAENGEKKVIMLKMGSSKKDNSSKKQKKIIRKRIEKSSN